MTASSATSHVVRSHEAGGSDVLHVKRRATPVPGDAVSIIPVFSMSRYDVYGEHAVVPAHAVARHSERLSFEEATSIWMQYLTAWAGWSRSAAFGPGRP